MFIGKTEELPLDSVEAKLVEDLLELSVRQREGLIQHALVVSHYGGGEERMQGVQPDVDHSGGLGKADRRPCSR